MKRTLLTLSIFVLIIWGIAATTGCSNKETGSKGDNKTSQPAQQAAVIEEVLYKVTPLRANVKTDAEHVSVIINDVLDAEKLGISADDLMSYRIQLYVHPMQAEKWWRQNKAQVALEWSAQAYLGGIGQYSAKNGEQFQVVAVLTNRNEELPGSVEQLQVLSNMEGVYIISKIRTMTVKR